MALQEEGDEQSMLACHYYKFGGPEVDQVGQIPRPLPSDLQEGQVLLEMHASSLNPADYKSRSGSQKALLSLKLPQVHGFDFSGKVIASRHDDFAEGDEVFGMCLGLRRGGLAEYYIVDGRVCVKKPPSISHEEAASMPLVGITSILAFRAADLREGRSDGLGPRCLILGGAGGVGSCAIQLAKGLYNASYVATTASAAKSDFVVSLGVHRVVDHRKEDFSKVLASKDESKLFDFIFDTVGEAKKCPELLRKGGGLVSIATAPTIAGLKTFLDSSDTRSFHKITWGVEGFLMSSIGGAIFDRVTGAKSLAARCKKRGATYSHIVGTGNQEIVQILANEMESGRLKACIDKSYALADSLEALKHIESGRTTGKVVIKIR